MPSSRGEKCRPLGAGSLITDCGAIAPRVGGAHERAGTGLNHDAVGMAGAFLPRAPTVEEMSPALQFAKRRGGETRLYVQQISRLSQSVPAKQPAWRPYRLLGR